MKGKRYRGKNEGGDSRSYSRTRGLLLWSCSGIALVMLFVARVKADPLPFGISLTNEHKSHPELVAGLGALWARTSVWWDRTEPLNTTPSNYDWTEPDKDFMALQQLGLDPIVLVLRNPEWAATTSCGPIDLVSLEELAEFVAALAERYDGDEDYDGDGTTDGPAMLNVTHWEFYNEPDCRDEEVGESLGGCWGNHGAEYAQMLAVAWEAMHSVNEETVILFGSLAAEPFLPWFNFKMDGGDFLDDALEYMEAHPGDYFDWMNFHHYCTFEARWTEHGAGIMGKAEYLRRRLAGHGFSKPIACTEAGLRSDKQCADMPYGDEGQSRYLVYTQVRGASWGIRAVTWFKMTDVAQKWGLVDEAYQKKPSYWAYEVLTRQLEGAVPLGSASLTEGIEAYEFRLPDGGSKTVLWSTDETTRTISFAEPRLRLTDKYGSWAVAVDGGLGDLDDVANGHVRIEFDGSPVYVEPQLAVTPPNTPTPMPIFSVRLPLVWKRG